MKVKNILMATSVAALLVSGAVAVARADDSAGKVPCMGVNDCKGHGSCKSAQNDCKGKNGCKGQGMMMMSKEECNAKGGKVDESKK